MAEVIVHKRVARYLKRLPAPEKARLKRALEEIGREPVQGSQVRRMVGEWEGYYRVRVGSYRIIYWYEPTEERVYADYIGQRGDVYK